MQPIQVLLRRVAATSSGPHPWPPHDRCQQFAPGDGHPTFIRPAPGAWRPPRVVIGEGNVGSARQFDSDGARRGTAVARPLHDPDIGQGSAYRRRADKDRYLKRLRRVEGQIRGLQRMVEADKYCIDILTQVSAETKALQSFSLDLLDEHLSHCVVEAAQRGGPEAEDKVREASEAIARLVRS